MIIKLKDKKRHVIFFTKETPFKFNGCLRKAIFFDRDGVLIKDMHYIKDPQNVSLLNGVDDLLNYTKRLGYLNIIITNQSGISKNLFTWEDYEKVTKRMLALMKTKNSINAIYANGENSNDLLENKSWRKPNPNMILKAAKDFNLELSESILIGDRLSDISSGERAGIKNLFHVLTGHGKNERKEVLKNFSQKEKNYNLFLISDLTYFKKEDVSNRDSFLKIH
tara:strand:- start:18 stop:686 length:669 start_codon:yes stop_codon:yes gene_type:complete